MGSSLKSEPFRAITPWYQRSPDFLPLFLSSSTYVLSPSLDVTQIMASDLLSKQSLTALGFVTSLVVGANVGTNTLLPKASSTKSRYIFTWLAFDALCHFIIEGSFLYYSVNGRTINSTTSFLAVSQSCAVKTYWHSSIHVRQRH
jgi:hypothetical protein